MYSLVSPKYLGNLSVYLWRGRRESPINMGFLWEKAFDKLDKIQYTHHKNKAFDEILR